MPNVRPPTAITPPTRARNRGRWFGMLVEMVLEVSLLCMTCLSSAPRGGAADSVEPAAQHTAGNGLTVGEQRLSGDVSDGSFPEPPPVANSRTPSLSWDDDALISR